MLKDFYNSVIERGLYSINPLMKKELKKTLSKQSTGYIGFDCTSDSLHVGSLLPLMLLRLFQKSGHKPIILVGGGTTLIGDPSGKDETRKILKKSDIDFNKKKKLTAIFKKFYLSTNPNLIVPL